MVLLCSLVLFIFFNMFNVDVIWSVLYLKLIIVGISHSCSIKKETSYQPFCFQKKIENQVFLPTLDLFKLK